MNIRINRAWMSGIAAAWMVAANPATAGHTWAGWGTRGGASVGAADSCGATGPMRG